MPLSTIRFPLKKRSGWLVRSNSFARSQRLGKIRPEKFHYGDRLHWGDSERPRLRLKRKYVKYMKVIITTLAVHCGKAFSGQEAKLFLSED